MFVGSNAVQIVDREVRLLVGEHEETVTQLVRQSAALTIAEPAAIGPRRGSVSTRASKDRLLSRTCGDFPSCGLQDGQHGHGPPEVEQSPAVGGHVLMVAGARAEEVAQFIVSATELGG